MPIQPPTKPTDGDEVQISFFDDVYTETETYLNRAIKSGSDFKTIATGSSPIVQTRHIYKPDFYGSPSVRSEAVSSETYWRSVGHGVENISFHHPNIGAKTNDAATEKRQANGWVPVRNLGATINVVDNSTPVTILSSFYAYEMGGALEGWGSGVTDGAYGAGTLLNGQLENQWCAEFALFIDGVRKDYTERFLYASTAWQHMHSRKQFSIVFARNFNAGIHHINIMCNVRSLAGAPGMGSLDFATDSEQNVGGLRGFRNEDQSKAFPAAAWKHIMVGGRSLVVDVHAL